MRRPIIAGNWKMYKTVSETIRFMEEFKPFVENARHCDIVLAPAFTALGEAVRAAKGTSILVASQDVFWEKEGAFTGEISAPMIADLGCRFAIIGHSERRQLFGETDEHVNQKIRTTLDAGLTPLV